MSVVVASVFAVITGYTLNRGDSPVNKFIEIRDDSWGYIIVEKGDGADEGKTFLRIANETGEGICVHANVYVNGNWIPVYGYVPAWANTKKNATYIYWSESRFGLRDVEDEDYHTNNICPKSIKSQY